MSNTEQLEPKELIQQAKEIELLNSNFTIKCAYCKVIFPREYDKCPQCEVDVLWKKVNIQYENYFGGKQN